MTDSAGIVAFVRARLDEEERAARLSIEQASLHLVGADPHRIGLWHVVHRPATGVFVVARDQWDRETEIAPIYGASYANYIALNDPARVLADIEAKRRLLEMHRPVVLQRVVDGGSLDTQDVVACEYDTDPDGVDWVDFPCETLHLLALPHAGHPDYREDWRP